MSDVENFVVWQVSNWPNPLEGGFAITGGGGKCLS
jgi:hypothetical protein